MPSSKVLGRIGRAAGKGRRLKLLAFLIAAAVVLTAIVWVISIKNPFDRNLPGDEPSGGTPPEAVPPTGHGYVAITFDDGSKTVYQNAYPIMTDKGIPGTAFVVTDNIGGSFEDRPCMNATDLRDLQANGWEIGSHSMSHADFSEISSQAAMSELKGSKSALEALGLHATSFAYPWGRYDQDDVAEAAQVYDRQRSTEERSSASALFLQDYSPGIPIVGAITPKSLGDAEALIDKAVATDSVVVFIFHDVPPDGELSTPQSKTDLHDLVDYIAAEERSDGLRAITFKDLPTAATESYVWDGGGGDELASDPANWYRASASGRIVNDAPLISNAHYIWNATSSKNCTWDLDAQNLAACSLTIAQGYTGTVRQGSVDIGIGCGGYYQGAGTFIGNKTRTVRDSGAVTVVGGTYASDTFNWRKTG